MRPNACQRNWLKYINAGRDPFCPKPNPPSSKFCYGINGTVSWNFQIIILISNKNSPLEGCEIFWREILNKWHCGNVLTPPKVKNKRTEFAAVAQLGEVDRNIILPGTLPVIGFSLFHRRIAKGFFSI